MVKKAKKRKINLQIVRDQIAEIRRNYPDIKITYAVDITPKNDKYKNQCRWHNPQM